MSTKSNLSRCSVQSFSSLILMLKFSFSPYRIGPAHPPRRWFGPCSTLTIKSPLALQAHWAFIVNAIFASTTWRGRRPQLNERIEKALNFVAGSNITRMKNQIIKYRAELIWTIPMHIDWPRTPHKTDVPYLHGRIYGAETIKARIETRVANPIGIVTESMLPISRDISFPAI